MAEAFCNGALTVAAVITAYLEFLAGAGWRQRSLVTCQGALRRFFAPVLALLLPALSANRAAALYDALRRSPSARGGMLAAATHRTYLGYAKQLMSWCVGQRLLRSNPLDEVAPVGIRNRGKRQLRLDEARTLVRLCLARASSDDGALAVLFALVLGMRADEIASRTVRDVDSGGTVLWVDESITGWKPKSAAGRRPIELPDVLQPFIKQRMLDQPADGFLFRLPTGKRHHHNWPRDSTHRLCRMAGLPLVCAHALRGQHATVAIQAGSTPATVAATLGHQAESMTLSAYAAPGSAQLARQRKLTAQLLR